MKVLFLDIDGVVNCKDTMQRHRGMIGIDPHMAFMVGKIVLDTQCEIILSSTWRLHEDWRKEVRDQVYNFIDITPQFPGEIRGKEIADWLSKHPEVTKYAILDDDGDMLTEQLDNFFQTSWSTGLTPEIAKRVTDHLNQ